jgi:hypothetical protein
MRSASFTPVRSACRLQLARQGRQGGAVAIVVAIAMIAMIGIVGLALDLGKLYVARAELQNAADACALAAVHSLNGATTRQLEIAEAAGLTTGLRNKVQFQNNTVNLRQNASIEFAESAESAEEEWLSKNELNSGDDRILRMRRARCTINETGIETWFIQVLNVLPGVAIGSQQVAASAVASLLSAQTTCAMPLAICTEQLAVNSQIGQWIKGGDSPSADGSSNFRWVDLNLDSKNSSTRDIADMLSGNGACELPVKGTQVGSAGVRAGLSNEWNTRFGIYQGGAYSAESNPPDFSGYAYTTKTWPAGPDGNRSNAFEDFISKRSSYAPYQGDSLAGLVTGSGPGIQAAHVNYGRLRRVLPAPVINCSELDKGTKKTLIQDWACLFMLHPISRGAGGGNDGYLYLEYRGKASALGSPCASTGLPGDIAGNGPLVPTLSR